MIYLLLKINGEYEAIIQEDLESIATAADIENIIEMIKNERKVSNVEIVSYKNIERPEQYLDKDIRYVVKYLDRDRDVVDYKDIVVPEGIVSFDALQHLVDYIHEKYQVALYLLDWQVTKILVRGDDS